MTLAELENLMMVRSEDEHIEFKEAKTRFDFERLMAYCVAMANEGGGMIVLGVTDQPPRKVVGTQAFPEPESTISSIYSRIQVKVQWQEIIHKDGRVLVFDVPSRPIGHPVHYEGRYWMRAGEELVPMTSDQLKRIIAEGEPDFVDQVAKSGLGEDVAVSLLDVQCYYDYRARPMPSTRREILNTFVARGFLKKDGHFYAITNMGALLFAKNIGDFPSVSRKRVRVVVYDGISKERVKQGKDVIGQKGYVAGFDALIKYVVDQLPANEEIAIAIRKTTHAYPRKAIREIIGNAIVHQNLTERGTGIAVDIYDDRIEVTNPGLPILPVDRFIDENQSRNERFADALRQLGICEERGYGMDGVVAEIEEYQLPPYQCRLGSHHTTITLSRYKPLKELTPEEKIYAVYQHCCLRFVNNQITNNESIRERFKIAKQNAATASRLLADAVSAAKIKPVDEKAANKLMKYVPYWA